MMMMNQGNGQQMQQLCAQALIQAIQQKSQISPIRMHICQSLSQNNFNNQAVMTLVAGVIDVATWNSSMNNIDIQSSIQQAAAKMADWYTARESTTNPVIKQNLTQQQFQEAQMLINESNGVQNGIAQWKLQQQQQMQQTQMMGMGMGMGGMAVGAPMMGVGGFGMQTGFGGMMQMPVARRTGGHANANQIGQQVMMGGMQTGIPASTGFFGNSAGVMGAVDGVGIGTVLGVPDQNQHQSLAMGQVTRAELAPISRQAPALTPGRPLTTEPLITPPLNVPQPNLSSGESEVSNENMPDGGIIMLDYANHATYALLPALTKAESDTYVSSEETLDGIVQRMGTLPYPKVPKPTTEGAVKMKDIPVNNAIDLGEFSTSQHFPNLLTVIKTKVDEMAPEVDIGDTVVRLRYTALHPWSLIASDLNEMRKQVVKGAVTHLKLINFLDRILNNALHGTPELHRTLVLESTKLANYIIRHEIGLNITIDSYALDATDLHDDLMKRGKNAEADAWATAAKTISDTVLRIYDDEHYQNIMKDDVDGAIDQAGFGISHDIITIPMLSSQLPLGAQKPKGYKGVRFGVVYKHAHPGLHRLCTGFFAEKSASAYKLLMTPDGRCLHVHKSRTDDTYMLTEIRL